MSQLQNLHFEIEAFKVTPETIVVSAVDDEGGGGRRKMRHASKEGRGGGRTDYGSGSCTQLWRQLTTLAPH